MPLPEIPLVVALALVVFFICVAMSPVSVTLEYHHHAEDDRGHVLITALWRIIRIRRELGAVKVHRTEEGPAIAVHGSDSQPDTTAPAEEADSPQKQQFTFEDFWQSLRNFGSWRHLFGQFKRQLSAVLRHTTVDALNLHATIGTGDVIATGMLVGVGYATVEPVVAWFLKRVRNVRGQPTIRFVPSFQTPPMWSVDFTCILHIRLGNAIVAAIQMIRLWRRRPLHGTSHSRVDAYRHVQYP